MTPSIEGWANFYVIVGSSAGALIGLQFVVIALVSSLRTVTQSEPIRAFATPTIVFFTSVVVISGVVNIPRHTRTSLAIVLLLIGGGGLVYVARGVNRMRRQDSYAPDAEDWAWFVWLPAAAYASVVIAGILVWRTSSGLYVVAGGAMALLLVGVHNAWDSAVHLVATSGADAAKGSGPG